MKKLNSRRPTVISVRIVVKTEESDEININENWVFVLLHTFKW